MSFSFPDAMVIQAADFGPAMTARQSIQSAKKIMLDLGTMSPWRRPFAVSGSPRKPTACRSRRIFPTSTKW